MQTFWVNLGMIGLLWAPGSMLVAYMIRSDEIVNDTHLEGPEFLFQVFGSWWTFWRLLERAIMNSIGTNRPGRLS